MPRHKKNQPTEGENLLLPVDGEAAPEAEAAPPARRGAGGNANTAAARALDAGRRTAIEKTLTDLTKRFGDGAIMRLGEATHMTVESIPTGSLAIDIALGIGHHALRKRRAHELLATHLVVNPASLCAKFWGENPSVSEGVCLA